MYRCQGRPFRRCLHVPRGLSEEHRQHGIERPRAQLVAVAAELRDERHAVHGRLAGRWRMWILNETEEEVPEHVQGVEPLGQLRHASITCRRVELSVGAELEPAAVAL